ncbi:MAG: helix-turn-helix transcriptional regulator [Clostridiales bacterium]|nr:helix-turn-helix transcriptional regulator [Clostridiales bacterium]
MCDNINNVQLKVIDYGHATSGREWIGNIVTPPYARLYFIIGGDPYIISEGKHIPLNVGSCYLMPTGYSFRYACEDSMEQLYFHLNLTDYSGADLLRSCNQLMEYALGAEKIRELLQHSERDDLLGGLLLRQELYNTLLILIQKYNIRLESVHYSRCVLLAIEYIKSHLSLQLGITELAANSFVSESTLAKKFKAEVGMTIGNYIDETILFESEQLLTKTELSVLQISERFGFCDQFYFSRRFKSKFGETPQKYRKIKPI